MSFAEGEEDMKKFSVLCMLLCLCSVSLLGCKKSTKDTIDQQKVEQNKENLEKVNENLRFEVQAIDETIKVETPYMTKEEFPILDGSTANVPLGEEIYAFLTGTTKEEAQNAIEFHKTSQAYYRLYNKEADILIIYEPSQGVLDEIEDGNQFLFKPLGRDALVFLANENNSVNSLTKQQIIDIYSGKTTKWSEVGGADMDIIPFQRPEASGSQSLMEKLAVNSDVIMKGPSVGRPTEMGDLIDTLAAYNNDNNAIGYSVYYYAKFMYGKTGLKLLQIDGVEPNNKTIQSLEYPYVNDFYVVIRKDEPEDSNARKLYNWLTTKEGQEHVVNAGYVPVVDLTAKSEHDIISGLTDDLKIGDKYFVLHESDADGTVIGDSLCNSKLECVQYFPGKEIQCMDADLLINKDEVIVLANSDFITNEEEMWRNYTYQLYNVATMSYVNDKKYNYINRTDKGYFLCGVDESYTYDMLTDDGMMASDYYYYDIFTADGKLVMEHIVCINGSVVMVGDKVFFANNSDHTLSIYDNQGKLLEQDTLEGDYYLQQDSHSYGNDYIIDTSYVFFSIYEEPNKYRIYDENGNQIDMAKVYQKSGKKLPSGVYNVRRHSNGKLYIAYYDETKAYVSDSDGNCVFSKKITNGDYYISLMPNCISIYNRDTFEDIFYSYDGKELGDTSKVKVDYGMEQILILKGDKYTAYQSGDYPVQELEYHGGEAGALYYEGMKYVTGLISYMETEIVPEGEEAETKYYCYYKGKQYLGCYGAIEAEGYTVLLAIDEESPSYVLDVKGNTIYTTKGDEKITNLIIGDEIYIYVTKGNYMGIKSLDGNFIYKQYAAHLLND